MAFYCESLPSWAERIYAIHNECLSDFHFLEPTPSHARRPTNQQANSIGPASQLPRQSRYATSNKRKKLQFLRV